MRVIAGTARGTILKAGRGLEIRPTSDRVKEAVFSILGEKVKNACFLDLFAGSGALAIEALSRGAGGAVLVESSPRCAGIIKHNLDVTGTAEMAELVVSDVYKYLESAVSRGVKFDIISADPPYTGRDSSVCNRLSQAEKTLLQLIENDILVQDGLIFIEHDISEKFSCESVLKPLSTREYGTTAVSFFGKS